MRRPAKYQCHNGSIPLLCIAFGAGIVLAMFCSLKLVVVLAGIFLIVLGFSCRC